MIEQENYKNKACMKILYIENHTTFARTVEKLFLPEYEVIIVSTVMSAKAMLNEKTFHIALIDYDLDDGKGDEIASWIKINFPKMKIIATSSHSEGNKQIQTAGADDVCPKNQFKKINEKIRRLF